MTVPTSPPRNRRRNADHLSFSRRATAGVAAATFRSSRAWARLTGDPSHAFMSLQRLAMRPNTQSATAHTMPVMAKGIHTMYCGS